MATIGKVIATPEVGWKRYDYAHKLIQYEGIGWSLNTGSGGTSYQTNKPLTDTIKFAFVGNQLRIMSKTSTNYSNQIEIKIDDNIDIFSENIGSSAYSTNLVYEKTGLANKKHIVEIKSVSDNSSFNLGNIDINDTGRLFHPDEITDIKDLKIGKRIRCNYQVTTARTIGVFGGLGGETSNFIPAISTDIPNGDFYFVCVDKDYLGRWKLIADRNIQHNVSWDDLNTAGIANGVDIVMSGKVIYETPIETKAVPYITAEVIYCGGIWHPFDGSMVTYWYTSIPGYNGKYPESSDGYWIQYDFGENNKQAINFLRLKPFNYSSSGLYTVATFVFKGSNDGVYFDTIFRGTHINNDTQMDYIFNNKTHYRYYRIYSRGYGNNGDITGLTNIKMISYQIFNDMFTISLLTGGTSANDKDNEWDKYIVNSNLNGMISAGDNNVWNVNLIAGLHQHHQQIREKW
ncbi:hypothetical protein ABE042_20250 [Viridibacillus arvi]|uniref:hypothetical protein n=1 Tax=Viridibacillus arvi TaxID=263475 RepID=UPI003D2A8D2F